MLGDPAAGQAAERRGRHREADHRRRDAPEQRIRRHYLTLRQAVTPDPLLGRVTATMICLTVATAPFGGLAGGWIAEHAGLRATLLLAGLGAIALVPLVAWASPLLRLRTLDEAQEPRQTESVAEELAG